MGRSLDQLLLLWEEHRERGEAVSAASLCPDSPEDAAELERRIRLLEALEKVLAADTSGYTPRAVPTPPERVGSYLIRRELGRGGSGVVYEAWDPNLKRVVAVKVFRPSVPAGGTTTARWQADRIGHDAQVLAQLKHEHIVPVYEAGVHDGVPYFTMQYVTGGSLADQRAALTAAGPLEVVACLEKVARAVAYLHGRNILHGDLKPGNILLGADGNPLVSDFGLARLLDAGGAPPDPTRAAAETAGPAAPGGATVGAPAPSHHPGTVPYMAPEQFDASIAPLGPATDVWALGVILYELLTGIKPFPGTARDQIRAQVCGGRCQRPRDVCPRLDARLERVILRCLAPSPGARYPSAAALAKELNAWQKSSRRPWLVAVVVALIVAPLAVPLWPPPDPEQVYSRRAEALVGELRRRGTVELISPHPLESPAFRVRSGQAGTVVQALAGGPTIPGGPALPGGLGVYAPAHCCLIELLPEVPVANYRLRARLRPRKPLNTVQAKWGVYCRHRALLTTQGTQHYFSAAYFTGSDELKNPPPRLGTLGASLTPRLFCELRRPSDRPFNDFSGFQERGDGSKTFHQYIRYPLGRTPPGAEIEVAVAGYVISAVARVDSGDGVADKLCITAEDQQATKLAVVKMFPALAGFSPDQLAGSALGIFISEADCTVESFVVDRLDDR